MSQDVTKIQLFGPASVSVGGSDIGHTDDKGVKISVKPEIIHAMAGKYGKTPVRSFLSSLEAQVEFTLIQSTMADLVKVLPGATKVTSGADSKLTFGKIAGSSLTGVALIFAPMGSGQDPDYRLTIPNAVPIGDWEVEYTGEKANAWKVKFKVLIDEAGGTDGKYMFTFGDTSITTDAVAPVISAFLPLDDEAAAALDCTPTATISKALDGNTVTTASVYLVKDILVTCVKVAGTVTLTNNGASTTVVFTPTSPLTATSTYSFILTDAIKDTNGNALAFSEADFTTLTP